MLFLEKPFYMGYFLFSLFTCTFWHILCFSPIIYRPQISVNKLYCKKHEQSELKSLPQGYIFFSFTLWFSTFQLWHVETYSDMFRNYSGIFRTLYNPGIFRTLVYSESETEACSEPCWKSTMEQVAKIVNRCSCFCKLFLQ